MQKYNLIMILLIIIILILNILISCDLFTPPLEFDEEYTSPSSSNSV